MQTSAAGDPPIYAGPWAGRPGSADSGAVITVTDIGGRSAFYFDGSHWRPLGGRVTLAALAGSLTHPVAQGTSAGNAALLLGMPGGAVKVPAGLLVPRQSVLRVSAFWSKLGSSGPINCVTCFGRTNSFSDSQVTGTFIGPGARALWNMQIDIAVGDTKRAHVNSLVVANGASAPPSGSNEFATAIDTAADMWLNFGSTNAVGGDGIALAHLVVEVFQ